MIASNRWQLLLGGLFLAFLAFSGWAVQQAYSRVSPLADPDYYSSGQLYHQQDQAWRAATEAGWEAWLGREGAIWWLRLVDGDGEPAGGGRVLLQALAPGGRPLERWRLELVEVSPGLYRAEAAAPPPGAGQLQLAVSRDAARWEQRLWVNGASWDEVRLTP